MAKINQVPIFHVNADDPEAAHRVLQIALDYRQEFHKDVVIDLVGFRRHGHNEGDEPAYTQPLMYQRIREHPGVFAIYARKLVARRRADARRRSKSSRPTRLGALRERARASEGDRARRRRQAAPPAPGRHASRAEPETGVPRAALSRSRRRARRGCRRDSTLNPKVDRAARPAARRWHGGRAPADWGGGRGARVRLAPDRGDKRPALAARTRARHVLAAALVLHDTQTGERGRRSRRSRNPRTPAPLRGLRQLALGSRRARLRIRLQHRLARDARRSGRRSTAISSTPRR